MDAKPIGPPFPNNSQESYGFRYIDGEELPPIKPDMHHSLSSTGFYDCNSLDFTEEQISAMTQRLLTSPSEIEGPICDLESFNPINTADALNTGLIRKSSLHQPPPHGPGYFMPQLSPQSNFGNFHITVDHSQHEIRYQTSNPKAATETKLMQDHLINFATMAATNLNEVRIIPGISSYTNNVWTSTRQPSQSNSASGHFTNQHYHQMSSMDKISHTYLHYSQDIWNNQLDFSHSSAPIIGDEGFNQNRFIKKRDKSAPVGESAKNCKCKKSGCLKLYCECFASGVYCMGSCLCQNCYNKPTHKDRVLVVRNASETRNPLAFVPKITGSTDYLAKNGINPNKTPASIGHIRGCNCMKSKCQKKYCECYKNGVGCSIKCRCTGCNNVYERNCYSKLRLETLTQRNESFGMLIAEKVPQVAKTLNNEGHPNSSATSSTSSWTYRSNAPLKRKQPSNFVIPDASGFNNASQRLNERSNILHNQLKFQDNFKSNDPELQMPNIHQVGDGSNSTIYINSCFTYIDNSSNSAREMTHYHPSPPFPVPNSLQNPTPYAKPTTPGSFLQRWN